MTISQTAILVGFLLSNSMHNQQQTKRLRNGDTNHPSVITISLIPVIPLKLGILCIIKQRKNMTLQIKASRDKKAKNFM